MPGPIAVLDADVLVPIVATMRLALEDQLVDGQAADVPAGINHKDHHVVAAAVVGAAQVIVTNDRRFRAEVEASGLEQAALDLDAFAMRLWRFSPADVGAVIDSMVTKRQRRPVSAGELIEALRRDMPSLATALRTT